MSKLVEHKIKYRDNNYLIKQFSSNHDTYLWELHNENGFIRYLNKFESGMIEAALDYKGDKVESI